MKQRTILVSGEKGGGGKSTLSTNLAVCRSRVGIETLLIDSDKIQNSSIWSDLRNEAGRAPGITCVQKLGLISKDITALKDKFPSIIIDAGGRDTVEMRQAMLVCDLMLVPVRPSFCDAATLTKLVSLLHELRELTGKSVSCKAVLNATSSHPQSREEADLREFLAQFSEVMTVLEPQVAERVAFRTAFKQGLGVVELGRGDQSAKASQEIMAVYEEIFK